MHIFDISILSSVFSSVVEKKREKSSKELR